MNALGFRENGFEEPLRFRVTLICRPQEPFRRLSLVLLEGRSERRHTQGSTGAFLVSRFRAESSPARGRRRPLASRPWMPPKPHSFGGVENDPSAPTRSVSQFAEVRKRSWESAVLSLDLIAKSLDDGT